jgi:hypothetical protein
MVARVKKPRGEQPKRTIYDCEQVLIKWAGDFVYFADNLDMEPSDPRFVILVLARQQALQCTATLTAACLLLNDEPITALQLIQGQSGITVQCEPRPFSASFMTLFMATDFIPQLKKAILMCEKDHWDGAIEPQAAAFAAWAAVHDLSLLVGLLTALVKALDNKCNDGIDLLKLAVMEGKP